MSVVQLSLLLHSEEEVFALDAPEVAGLLFGWILKHLKSRDLLERGSKLVPVSTSEPVSSATSSALLSLVRKELSLKKRAQVPCTRNALLWVICEFKGLSCCQKSGHRSPGLIRFAGITCHFSTFLRSVLVVTVHCRISGLNHRDCN